MFVHRGLVIHRPLSDLGLQVVCGVLHCDSLRKDLSYTNFVEDSDFEGVKIFLKGLALKLVTEFCANFDRDPQACKQLWSTVVNLLETEQLDCDQGRVVRAWADHLHQTGEDQGPFSSVQKARFFEKEGRTEEAMRLRRELLTQLQKESLACFDSGLLEGLPERVEVLSEVCKDLHMGQVGDLSLGLRFVKSLLGLPEEPEQSVEADDPLTLHRLALLRRWHGNLPGAVEYHLQALEHPDAGDLVRGWGIRYCAELEFSQQRYEQAEELYEMAEQELPKQRDLWEERAFFKRFLAPEQQSESLKYLKRAVSGVEADSFVHWLLVEELKRQGKSVMSRSELTALQTKSTYLKLKKLLEEGEQAEIESILNRGLELQGWTSREELMAHKLSAVERAERAFGPTYLYTRYCRRRCAYQLHRLGAFEEAQRLQCRGHLLEHLRVILKETVYR
jgi:tetratricopeptide (TPR) repeat protein